MLYTIVQKIVVEAPSGKEEDLADVVREGLKAAQSQALRDAGYIPKGSEAEVRQTLKEEALSLPRKKHMRSESTRTGTICEVWASKKNIVTDRDRVNCKLCLRVLEDAGDG
jgi:hypothetical protein